jgi:hypothetical protein
VGNVATTVTKVEKNNSIYRLALKASGISVVDDPLDQEPETVSPELRGLLSPVACIPNSWAENVSFLLLSRLNILVTCLEELECILR